MSIGPDSPWRGCAAYFHQPVSETDMLAAQCLVEHVYYFNCRVGTSPLHDIVYRSSNGEYDIVRHVFRWDLTPYEEIFRDGFQARRQQGTTDEVYYNLDQYVHHGGRPLDSRRVTTHPFVSTTLNSGWYPALNSGTRVVELYRYEIYAPGGIWVAETLDDRYRYTAQDEVCFVAGIAPQYIRSAQRFRLIYDPRGYTRRERVDTILRVNPNFNPQSHPPRQLRIQRPVLDYMANGRRARLTIRLDDVCPQREKRQVSINSTPTNWYADGGREKRRVSINPGPTNWYADGTANSESYIDAAFRSSRINEAYLFMKNEYVCLNYAPGTTNDKILNGPLLICDGFPSLRGTSFAEYGIDCAFRSSQEEEAFIFSGNLCAVIIYAPGTSDDKIKKGPMTITAMFPFLKGTVFESGVDAAFESTKNAEAYLFKGNQYARINYSTNCHLINGSSIAEGFPSLRNTIFESGIDTAFASHRYNEAYIFKGDSYTRINFAPASTDDYIIGGVNKIRPNWPSLRSILPRQNRGLDIHDHSTESGGRDQDEL